MKEYNKNSAIVILGHHLDRNRQTTNFGDSNVRYGLRAAEELEITKIILVGGRTNGLDIESEKHYEKFADEFGELSHELNGLDVHLETDSLDTYGNAYYGMKIIKERESQIKTIFVVANESHANRAFNTFTQVNKICGYGFELRCVRSTTGKFSDYIKGSFAEPFNQLYSKIFLAGVYNEEELLQRFSHMQRIRKAMKKIIYGIGLGY